MANRIGTVFLRVQNLEKQVDFYQKIIGLKIHHQEENTVFLGTGGDDLLALIHTPDAVQSRGSNGLYHFALLLPSREHLAQSLNHLLMNKTKLQGLSDHIVSEAIYLADPEGNGIEIYADREQSHWYKNGVLQMDTLPMDAQSVMRELKQSTGEKYQMPPETIMGHIHLHVDSVKQGVKFYQDSLSMDVMFQMPTAAFLSYDSYHHHLGINVWAGRVLHSDNHLGLSHFLLHTDETASQQILSDPSNNQLRLV